MGKLPKGFRRYYSSPLLNQEQYGCIKEVMPIACGNKVDPVYEALRFGTSLAQKAKRASGSDSPHRNSASDLDNVPEEVMAHSSRQELSRKHSDDVFTVIQNGAECLYLPERKTDDLPDFREKFTFHLATTNQTQADESPSLCEYRQAMTLNFRSAAIFCAAVVLGCSADGAKFMLQKEKG
ncbi:hypothetical protein AMECASPLE_022540 [Ameca splendens]|uniref:Uncharacterized protein n=1 Tax=Ameca splendens TaxID=208324 RepID=A0ABV0ZZR0_9TELE